jgi:hypothetical protein
MMSFHQTRWQKAKVWLHCLTHFHRRLTWETSFSDLKAHVVVHGCYDCDYQ